jgi:hypothetical protein
MPLDDVVSATCFANACRTMPAIPMRKSFPTRRALLEARRCGVRVCGKGHQLALDQQPCRAPHSLWARICCSVASVSVSCCDGWIAFQPTQEKSICGGGGSYLIRSQPLIEALINVALISIAYLLIVLTCSLGDCHAQLDRSLFDMPIPHQSRHKLLN